MTDGRGIALCKSVPSPLNPVRELRELHISATESDSGKGMKILFFFTRPCGSLRTCSVESMSNFVADDHSNAAVVHVAVDDRVVEFI